MLTTIRRIFRQFSNLLLVLALLGGAGCTVNPVTGGRELALLSTTDQIAIGEAQYFPARQMQGGDLVADPELTAYVASVGNRLADQSGLALPYEFVVLNSSVPNAWALPGGKIAVNRGLLLELDSEAELAAVLGHEIVHAAAGHGAQAMQRSMILQGVLLATTVAAQRSDYSDLSIGAASVGAQLLNQRYSRNAELEADYYGMGYLASAATIPKRPWRCRRRLCGLLRAGTKAGSPACSQVTRHRRNVSTETDRLPRHLRRTAFWNESAFRRRAAIYDATNPLTPPMTKVESRSWRIGCRTRRSSPTKRFNSCRKKRTSTRCWVTSTFGKIASRPRSIITRMRSRSTTRSFTTTCIKGSLIRH